jgi:tyrosine-specific transport protein
MKEKPFTATLLIAGCMIGAGMIGLPVISALAGFIPSMIAMVLAYFFATSTGLLLVEAALWFDEKVHLTSLAEFTLGRVGKWIAWSFFLFLFYAIFVAYIDGGGQIFSQLFSFSREAGIFAFVILVGSIVYVGVKAVGYVSRIFLLGLALSYGALIANSYCIKTGQQPLPRSPFCSSALGIKISCQRSFTIRKKMCRPFALPFFVVQASLL